MRYLDVYQASPDEVDELLGLPLLAVLATSDASGPDLGAYPFVYRGGRIEMHLERSDPQTSAVDRAGRGTVMITELLSTIPSCWADPDNVLHADAYHRTVVVRGAAEVVREPSALWEHLGSVLTRYQGSSPSLDPAVRRYSNAVDRLVLVRVTADEVRSKFKMGQQEPEVIRKRIIAGLRRRGTEKDLRTASLVAASLRA